jgi:carboxyl-terminal processing protease
MKLYRRILSSIVFTGLGVSVFAQSKDFDLSKNIDIFFTALKELQHGYVDSLSTEKLINYALDGIADNLDPYTEYIPAKDQSDFDFQLTGRYAGIGSLIQKDSLWAIIAGPYKGFPADRAGLTAGDRILEIDGQSITGMPLDKVSNMLKGEPGTTVKITVSKLRSGLSDTLAVVRESIHLRSVPYYGLSPDSIGYIRLTGFPEGCSGEVRKALSEFRATGRLKSLVLDLRNNGGGSLSEAVKIANLFLPKGTTVVKSAGRNKNEEYRYTTVADPIEPDLPIVVLVNSGTASASEIVSGSLQDLDRGIVLGRRTFGKGLVQTVRQVGYDAQLKYTTAKYYIPSGRCVQAHNFTTRNPDGSVAFIPDSLKKEFQTKNGRKVFDGGGITPDITVADDEYSPIAISLLRRNLIFKYSVEYYKKHLTVATPDKFDISEAEYKKFIDWLADKNYDYQTSSEQAMSRLLASAKQEKYYDDAKETLDQLNVLMKHDKVKDLKLNQKEISALLREEIAERYYYDEGRIQAMLRNDKQYDEACDLLRNQLKYANILVK